MHFRSYRENCFFWKSIYYIILYISDGWKSCFMSYSLEKWKTLQILGLPLLSSTSLGVPATFSTLELEVPKPTISSRAATPEFFVRILLGLPTETFIGDELLHLGILSEKNLSQLILLYNINTRFYLLFNDIVLFRGVVSGCLKVNS